MPISLLSFESILLFNIAIYFEGKQNFIFPNKIQLLFLVQRTDVQYDVIVA
jgi:hypothetical protein